MASRLRVLARFQGAIHIVDADDPNSETHCFTSAYGRSPVRSGSYLRTGSHVRRFSPAEILKLLGFPRTFRLPDEAPHRLWPLVGNSLSVVVVQSLLAGIPELQELLSGADG